MNEPSVNRIHNVGSLYHFIVEAITTCLSFNAEKVCVPFALFALSALLLFASCFMLLYQRCMVRQGNNTGEVVVVSIYCFLGNLCSTIGAVLSKQLDIQIVFGALTVAVDFVNIVAIFITLYICWNSTEVRRLRIIRRRRRQLLLAMMLMGLGGYVTRERIPAYRPFAGRKLLHAHLQDNTVVLGYALGLIALSISCTSRFPLIKRACRREKVTRAGAASALLCSLTGVLYISAALLSDTSAPTLLLRAGPWLLSALCSATLDLLVLFIFWWRKGARRPPERISLDARNLLELPRFHRKHGNKGKTHRKREDNNNTRTAKTSEIGHYMDISVQPAGKELNVSVRDNMGGGPQAKTAVQLLQLQGLSSSCSSYDSSSSELEWDFEEARTCWSEPPPGRPEMGDEFLQDWPKNPPPFGTCTCSISDFTEMPLFP